MIKTQPNENRCASMTEEHILQLPQCCPMTKNPQPGSSVTIKYSPKDKILEVASLFDYVNSYIGGKGEIRSMEGMIQQITTDCATATGVPVNVIAELFLEPDQMMRLNCTAGHRLLE